MKGFDGHACRRGIGQYDLEDGVLKLSISDVTFYNLQMLI